NSPSTIWAHRTFAHRVFPCCEPATPRSEFLQPPDQCGHGFGGGSSPRTQCPEAPQAGNPASVRRRDLWQQVSLRQYTAPRRWFHRQKGREEHHPLVIAPPSIN